MEEQWAQLEDGKWYDFSMSKSNIDKAIDLIYLMEKITIYQEDRHNTFSIDRDNITKITNNVVKQYRKGYFYKYGLKILAKSENKKMKIRSGDCHLHIDTDHRQVYGYIIEIDKPYINTFKTRDYYEMFITCDWKCFDSKTPHSPPSPIDSRFEILDL